MLVRLRLRHPPPLRGRVGVGGAQAHGMVAQLRTWPRRPPAACGVIRRTRNGICGRFCGRSNWRVSDSVDSSPSVAMSSISSARRTAWSSRSMAVSTTPPTPPNAGAPLGLRVGAIASCGFGTTTCFRILRALSKRSGAPLPISQARPPTLTLPLKGGGYESPAEPALAQAFLILESRAGRPRMTIKN